MMSTPTIIIGWIDLSLQKGFLFKSYFLFFLINISILTKASLLFIKIILWVDPSQQPAEVTPTRLHRFSTHTQVLTLHAQGSEETLSRQMKQHSNTCVAWNGSPTVRKSKCHVERIEAMGMEVDRLKMRTINCGCWAIHRKGHEEVKSGTATPELQQLFLIEWEFFVGLPPSQTFLKVWSAGKMSKMTGKMVESAFGSQTWENLLTSEVYSAVGDWVWKSFSFWI